MMAGQILAATVENLPQKTSKALGFHVPDLGHR